MGARETRCLCLTPFGPPKLKMIGDDFPSSAFLSPSSPTNKSQGGLGQPKRRKTRKNDETKGKGGGGEKPNGRKT